ncbi:hypothetical protein [Bacteroides timonensis]|uniref:hypothetical protein n=1 Tax=Bacteroides timonensis TaxID=1470345 RepID=UPI0005C791CD|nr:hypothetical protein [Bacteroides timonensis]
MKTLRLIGMAIVAVIMSVNFAACSDDDEEETPTNPLIGTWYEEPDTNGNYMVSTYNADGTGSEKEYYQGKFEEPYSFTYSYDKNTSIVTLHYVEEGYEDETDKYYITFNGNTMVMKDVDYGYESTWHKK